MLVTRKIFSYARRLAAHAGPAKAFYFLSYALLHRRAFANWLSFIEEGSAAAFPEDIRLRLAMRAAFRFVRPWMTADERIETFSVHYKILTGRIAAEAIAPFLDKSGAALATLTGKSGKTYTVKINGDVSKEGALRVMLADGDTGLRLASITGVIGHDRNGQGVFWVGSLQGAVADGKQMVSGATKDLNGLRPKQAVLHAVAALALWFGVKEIAAPSLSNQIAIKSGRKGQSIHTEYDDFWGEFTGGAVDAMGDYRLPLPLPRRKLEDVQQKRRKDWKLRYEKIDALSADISSALRKIQK